MHDDAEYNVAANTQAKRKNDPLLHHLIDLSSTWGVQVNLVRVPSEGGSVTPPASWLTQCPLL